MPLRSGFLGDVLGDVGAEDGPVVVEDGDGLGEGQRLDSGLDRGPVADDEDGHLAGVEVLLGDALDVGRGDGLDLVAVGREVVVGQVVEDQFGERAAQATAAATAAASTAAAAGDRLEPGGEALDQAVLGEGELRRRSRAGGR